MRADLFLSHYRATFREHLSQLQIDGLTRLLGSVTADPNMSDPRWGAYLLATTKHETGNTWQPITERGGEAYFMRRYWDNENVRHALGNLCPEDAIRFCGHGYVQLTGRLNAELFSGLLGLDLVGHPELALEHAHAYQIASVGMRHGKFTGRALGQYINAAGTDFFQARRVVNGTDKAGLIAGYAEKMLACFSEAP